MSSKKGAVIKQATFLMAAGLICRVIGLLYRSPLNAIIGEAGSGYYSYANDWYSILLLISAYSIPTAVSKVMSERLALKRYKDAQKVFRAALIYVLIVGGVTSILCYVLAPVMLKNASGAILALRVLAPTILLSGLLGVMRGYFQAQNTMMPTAISQIAEQIVNAIISILAAYFFTRSVTGEDMIGQMGAAGGTLGTSAGVITGLLFMCFVYGTNRKKVQTRVVQDVTKKEESYKDIFKVILLMVTPIIISTCVYNVSVVINQSIYTSMSIKNGLTEKAASEAYAAYSYYCNPILNIPIAMGSAMATAIIPAVSSHYALGEKKEMVSRIDECIRFTMFIAIPATVGLGVLAYPVIRLLYPSADLNAASVILMIGAISVVLSCFSSVTNGILQGIGKPKLPLIHAACALVADVVLLFVFMKIGLGVKGVMLTTILYTLIVCVLNAISIRKHLDYQLDVKNCFLYPAAAAVGMGVVVAVLYWIPFKLIPAVEESYMISAVFTMIAVVIGVLVYMILYLKTSKMTPDEIRKLPMGTKILRVAQILRIV